MQNDGFIRDYPCKCSGGEMCFIVEHPSVSPPPSYATRDRAEEVLRKICAGELTQADVYPNLKD